MKKVCHITTVHPLLDTRIFYKECKTLVGAGYDTILIVQHNKSEIVERIKIIPLPKPKNRLERIFSLSKKAYKLALDQKADIYHFHDPELLPWMVKLKKKIGAKIIYDVHEDYPKQILYKHWIPKILRNIIARSFNFYEKRAINNFDFITTVGEDVRERLGRVNPSIDTVKNFPLLEKFNIKRKRKRKDNNPFNLIYIGVLTEVRGITQIVQAMEYLPNNIKLLLLGTFSPENYEKTIRNLVGFKKTKYYGQVPFKEILEYLLKAKIGIICFLPEPNHINSCPNKLFEYMAAGLPVVASNFPSWREIVEINKCGICVNPLEPKEIARAVKYLIEYPEEAEKMSKNGRRAVLEKYNWGNESKKLLKIYEELAK